LLGLPPVHRCRWVSKLRNSASTFDGRNTVFLAPRVFTASGLSASQSNFAEPSNSAAMGPGRRVGGQVFIAADNLAHKVGPALWQLRDDDEVSDVDPERERDEWLAYVRWAGLPTFASSAVSPTSTRSPV